MRLIGLLFFASGACGLVYQIVWVRMLLPVFGAGVHAVSTVLTAFMAGLALGAWLFGRLADRKGGGLRLYGLLEVGIAASAALLPFAVAELDEVYTALYRAFADSPSAFAAARFALSAALLLVPTTLMGGTLPALVRYVSRSGIRVGRGAGLLYGLNTLGAVVGCALAAFLLIERLGIQGTTWVVASANLLLGVAAFVIARHAAAPAAEAAPAEPIPPAGRVAATTPALRRVVLWGYALSGFAALGYEVVWARVLSVVLRLTTTQSLSVILVVFLGGLGLGSAAGARRADRTLRPLAAFVRLEVLIGLAGLLSIFAVAVVPHVESALRHLPGWGGHATRLLAAATVVMGLPTFLMGWLFPVAARLRSAGIDEVARGVGGLYAANTAGAIAGAFAAGFLLLPALGSQRTIVVLALLNLAVAAAVAALDPLASLRARRAAPIVVLPALAALLLPASFLVERSWTGGSDALLYHAEGAAGTVSVREYPSGLRVLRVNGAGEVPTDWASIRVFRLLGTLPLVLHPDPDDVLVIAFGGGITLASVEDQAPARIVVAEIVPGVVGAAGHFAAWNDGIGARVPSDAIRLVFDDGRNHVLRTADRYDVILSDSTHPATADSWILYTAEFYRSCRSRLRDDGVFAQWLPLHGLTPRDYTMILRTFGSVFPHATLWHTRGYSVLLATPHPLRVDAGRLAARLAGPAVRDALVEVDLDTTEALLAALALDEDAFDRVAGDGPLNTDDRPFVGFGDRGRAGAAGVAIAAGLVPAMVTDDTAWIEGGDAALHDAVRRRRAARRYTIGAEAAAATGNRADAREALRRALELAPRDGTARRLLEELSAQRPRTGD